MRDAVEPRPPVGGRAVVALVAAAVLGIAVVALLFLVRDRGSAPEIGAARVTVAEFERRVDRRLEPVALRPATTLRVRASSVEWRDARGQRWLEAPAIAFAVDAGALRGEAILLRDGRISRPVLRLTQSPAGVWNYETALDPLLNGPERPGPPGGGLAVSLRNFMVEGGEVYVVRPDQRVAATGIDVRLTRALLTGPGVRDPTFEIASAEAVLDLPGGPDAERVTRPAAVADATVRLVDGAIAFDVGSGSFGASRFADAAGVWDPALGGWGLDAVLTAGPVVLADLPWLRTDLPEDAVASFRLRIEPFGADRNVLALSDLEVTGGASAASGALRVVVGGPALFALESADLTLEPLDLALVEAFTGPLPYAGALRGRVVGSDGAITFDVRATLSAPGIAGTFVTDLAGSVGFTPGGLDLERLTATFTDLPLAALESIAPGLPLAGPISGSVTLRGMPSEVPITLNVRLEAGGGIISVVGSLDLRGAVPAYDVQGSLAGVELRRLLAPSVPPVLVHAGFSLRGAGTDPATMAATLEADGNFTGWATDPGDTLSIRLRVADGSVTADRFRVLAGPIDAVAEGTWQFVAPGGGSIRYALRVESLEPLAPYLPPDPDGRRQFSRGSLDARGLLAGTLDRPVLAGSLEATDFRYGEWAASSFQGEYEYISTAGLPTIEAELAGVDLRTPFGDFDRADLRLDFTRPDFELVVAADQVDGGILEIDAAGRIDDLTGDREVQLRRMEIDLREQRWVLAEPALIAWTAGDAIQVDGLRLEQVDGDGLLRLTGIIAPADDAGFAVEVRSLPVGDLLEVFGLEREVEGVLTATAEVAGPADSPTFNAELLLVDGAVRGVVVRSLELELAYAGTDLSVVGIGALGEAAAVRIQGRIPMTMRLALIPGFELIDGAPMEGRLLTEDFPLATLDPGIPTVEDLVGLVDADVRVAGTPDAPVLSGTAAIREGAVTIPLLNQRYREVSGRATFEGRELVLEQLTARSGGTAVASGTVTFVELTDPTLDLRTELQGFQPQGVSNYGSAAAWGTLALTGTARQPDISGRVRLDDGTVEIAAFQGPTFEDQFNRPPEFDLVRPQDTDLPGVPTAGLTVSNLTVEAGSDLWFATDEARVQLSGTLRVNRQLGELAIQGLLSGDRGTFHLRVGPVTRRFDVVQANIRFFGNPEPNPGLDIVASRLVRTARSGDVEVRARLTGTLNSPSLSLATGDGATIPESEILSFLLFGRSEATLGTVAGEGGFLSFDEAIAFAGFFDLWSDQILRATDLGLDQFQIQMRPGGGLQGSNLFVIIGHEIVDDLFVTWESPLDPSNTIWALTGEWRIDRQWTLGAGFEPVNYGSGTSVPVPFLLGDRDRQQFFIAIRRRWTY